jgi:PKD repeat protein
MFTDTSTGTITNRTWNFGDGGATNTTLTTVGHTYTNAMVYTVTLTVSGPAGTSQFASSNSVYVTPMPYVGWFTNSYPLFGSSNLTIAPATAQGIFFVGDTVVISNNLPTNVELYDYHFNAMTSAPAPLVLTGLPMGHYFVECNGSNGGYGDRSQFSVLPQGYTNYPHVDFGCYAILVELGGVNNTNRYTRLAPGLARNQSWWVYGAPGGGGGVAVISENGSTLSNNWAVWDAVLGEYSNAPVNVFNIILGHGDSLYGGYGYYSAPPVDMTNSVWDWVTDVSLLYSNAAVRYGTNFIYEVPNEPGWPNIIFTNQNDVWTDPYWTNNAGALPAAMAVSATVEAVKFTCPECEVWGPAMIGFSAATDLNVTSYYAHVDALSHHNDMEQNMPIDNRFGGWLAMNEYNQQLTSIWGIPIYITEDYPNAPSPTGKMTSWYLTGGRSGGYTPSSDPYFGWDWRVFASRFWKELVMGEGCGIAGVENFCATFHPTFGIPLGDPISSCYGWDSDVPSTGAGPVPEVDGEAMISWWLTGSTPIANWLSGTMLMWENAMVLTNGTPGLHFWEFQFADGSRNTFVWADEGYSFTTNFGVGLTDIYSNSWTGSIGSEPVIAWGWPVPPPIAGFTATPTAGIAPLALVFVDSSTGNITNWFWNFGDGTYTTSPTPGTQHTYTTAGTYGVTETVTGLGGSSAPTRPTYITVLSPSQAIQFQAWLTQYLGCTNCVLTQINADADGTGQDNIFKYTAGLDPTNPASVFVLNIVPTNQPPQNNLSFYPLALGRTYMPEFSTDLTSGVWLPLATYLGPVTNDNGTQVSVIDTNPIPPQEFYRIEISLP